MTQPVLCRLWHRSEAFNLNFFQFLTFRMSQTTKVLVTGASRGLGQAFVDNLALQPHTHVYAGMRNAGDTGAQSNGSVQILALDVSSNESVRDAAAKVEELDILILNAGMGAPARLSETSPEELTQYLEANSIGVHRVIQAFLPALRKGREKKIILIASQSGSFARQVHSNSIGFGGPYAVSKAAGIMVAVQYHRELNTFNNEGFTVVPTHPG